MAEVRDVVAAASELTDAEFLAVVRAVAAGRPGLGALLAAVDVGSAVPTEDPVTAEIVPDTTPRLPEPDYTAGGVPTFDRVRDRIEERVGTAIGSEELAHESPSGRSVDEQWEARKKAGKAKLDEIRRSLGKQ
ncbi:hypothetical protein CBI38_13070 [Rhodococcus oxybenzonivorans]|jgi:hypothetical protein|uniref:Uncharacterized protein n=1 Tax=Rhodococcus oxybenzonivorans TaxID=1990687 RepID=A0A2S2BUQ9_9NOCA|nr:MULTISPECIES: hypothetical protein [Rhodococcus]AWK72370.1 hypothetical protein CBI38_13070 [Rhodococcus oxybenzonivorans]QTJ64565.1 hypothetical protein HYG77_02405 [Rhodococcus sp. ZPP]